MSNQTPTGRKQNDTPNLQPLPIRTQEGTRIIEAFKKCLSCGAPVFKDPDENGLPCGH